MEEQKPQQPEDPPAKPEGLLYHYTTLDGLLGILKSGSIRATHVRYLNDITEIKNAFRPKYTHVLLDALFPAAGEDLKVELSRQMEPATGKYDTFVISFTDDCALPKVDGVKPGDRLSQWRAYSGVSGGFSLGFDSKRLLEGWERCRLKDAGAAVYLVRCKYLESEKLGIARNIGLKHLERLEADVASKIGKFLETHSRPPNQNETDELKRACLVQSVGTAFTDYFLEASSFKDEAFAEEHEWRAVFHVVRKQLMELQNADTSKPVIHFRAGKFGVTPYAEFPLNLGTAESPLRKILVGPTPHWKEAVEAVRFLLQTNGVKVQCNESGEGIEVVESKIPYRNW